MDELAGGIEEEEEEEESMAKFSVSLLPEPAMALFCKKAPNSILFTVSTIIPRTRSKHTQGKHTCTLLPESTEAKVVHVFRRTIHPVTGISANNSGSSGKSKRSTDLFN